MEHIFCDVLVVGSGAAGLRAAISAKQKGVGVCVISKQAPGKATCTILSAGVFAGTEKNKSSGHHLRRTLQAGRGINQPELVKVLVEEGPMRLKELKKWGINAEFHRGYLFCKGRAPYRGREIVQCLLTENETLGTQFISGQLVTDLKPLEEAFGVLAYSPGVDKWLTIGAKSVILATGGAGALYLRHDNPKRMFGDGYVLALKAGAALQDMEFVQFYPLDLQRRIEILLGAQAASLIIQAALKRKESRGSHFREDFSDQDDDNWQGHLQVKLSRNGEANWNFRAIS